MSENDTPIPAKKKIARVAFTITSEGGSTMFSEGQPVPAEIAAKYPHFMVGHVPAEAAKHDPTLPIKLSKATAEKMTDERLLAWVKQYHPNSVPAAKVDHAALVALVVELQGE